MDLGFIVGGALIVIGLLLFAINRKVRASKTSTQNRSVSIGGNNSGLINTGDIKTTSQSGEKDSKVLPWFAALVELSGICVTLWTTYQTLAK